VRDGALIEEAVTEPAKTAERQAYPASNPQARRGSGEA